MLYSSIVKKRIGQSFDQVNNHRWDELFGDNAPTRQITAFSEPTRSVASAMTGKRSAGGLSRLGRVLPNLKLYDQQHLGGELARGTPRSFVQWDGNASLPERGDQCPSTQFT